MRGILEDWDAAAAFFAGQAESGPPGDSKPLSYVRILPPILYPGEIWAAGANYQDHISEMGESEYKAVNAKTVSGGRAWHFAKPSSSSLVAQGSTNPLPCRSEERRAGNECVTTCRFRWPTNPTTNNRHYHNLTLFQR